MFPSAIVAMYENKGTRSGELTLRSAHKSFDARLGNQSR